MGAILNIYVSIALLGVALIVLTVIMRIRTIGFIEFLRRFQYRFKNIKSLVIKSKSKTGSQ